MPPYSRLLLLLALASLVLARARAAPSVPFNASLVGREFRFVRSGVRFPVLARLEVSETAIAYFPRYQPRGPLGALDPFCFRSYQLRLSRDVRQLQFVVYGDNSPGCGCDDGCVQVTDSSTPTGPNSATFQSDIRLLFSATRALRNSDGSENNLCFGDCQPTPRPELDGILTYLYGIGYALGFCVDPAAS